MKNSIEAIAQRGRAGLRRKLLQHGYFTCRCRPARQCRRSRGAAAAPGVSGGGLPRAPGLRPGRFHLMSVPRRCRYAVSAMISLSASPVGPCCASTSAAIAFAWAAMDAGAVSISPSV